MPPKRRDAKLQSINNNDSSNNNNGSNTSSNSNNNNTSHSELNTGNLESDVVNNFNKILSSKMKECRWVNAFNCNAGSRIRDIRPAGVQKIKRVLQHSFIRTHPIIVTDNPASSISNDSDATMISVDPPSTTTEIDESLVKLQAELGSTCLDKIDIHGYYSVTEGMHRIIAIRELFQEKKIRHPFVYALVMHDLTEVESVIIAAASNDVNDTVVETTIYDKFVLFDRLTEICKNYLRGKGTKQKSIKQDDVWNLSIEALGKCPGFDNQTTFRVNYCTWECFQDEKLRSLLVEDQDREAPIFSFNMLSSTYFRCLSYNGDKNMLRYVMMKRVIYVHDHAREKLFRASVGQKKNLTIHSKELWKEIAELSEYAIEQWEILVNLMNQRTVKLTTKLEKEKTLLYHKLMFSGDYDEQLLELKGNNRAKLIKGLESAISKLLPRQGSGKDEKLNENDMENDFDMNQEVFDDDHMTNSSDIVSPNKSYTSISPSGSGSSKNSNCSKKTSNSIISDNSINTDSTTSTFDQTTNLPSVNVAAQTLAQLQLKQAEEAEKERRKNEEKQKQEQQHKKLMDLFQDRFALFKGNCISGLSDIKLTKYEGTVNLILTDPPFNILKKSSSSSQIAEDDFIDQHTMNDFARLADKYLCPTGTLIIYCNWLQLHKWAEAISKTRLIFERNPTYIVKNVNNIQRTKKNCHLVNAVYTALVAHKSNDYYRELGSNSEAAKDELLKPPYNYPPFCNVIVGAKTPHATTYLRKQQNVQVNNNNSGNTNNSNSNSNSNNDDNNISNSMMAFDEEQDDDKQLEIDDKSQQIGARYRVQEKSSDFWRPFIKRYTKKDDIIMDAFAGTMSLGLECVKYGRKFIGIEQDEECFDAASKRLIDFWISKMIESESSGQNPKQKSKKRKTILWACKDCGIMPSIKPDVIPWQDNTDFCSKLCAEGAQLKAELVNMKRKANVRPIEGFYILSCIPHFIANLSRTHKAFEGIDYYEMFDKKEWNKEQLEAAWKAEQIHYGLNAEVISDPIHRYGVRLNINGSPNRPIGVMYGHLLSKLQELLEKNECRVFNRAHKSEENFTELEKTEKFAESGLFESDISILAMHDLSVFGRVNSCWDNKAKEFKVDLLNAGFESHPVLTNAEYYNWYMNQGYPPPAPLIVKLLNKPIEKDAILKFNYPIVDNDYPLIDIDNAIETESVSGTNNNHDEDYSGPTSNKKYKTIKSKGKASINTSGST